MMTAILHGRPAFGKWFAVFSGSRQRLGAITKEGNCHCRHLLVQAAWSYRHRPQTSVDLQAAAGGATADGDRARVESAAAVARALEP
ncbi:MAG: transposase, partial [Burkholderiaceae bacterium]